MVTILQDHPKDAEFLNVPLVNYVQMQAIFASGVATSRYAMGINEPLGAPAPEDPIEVDAEEPAITHEGKCNASDQKSKAASCQTLGKRKRGICEEEGAYIAGLTDDVWGFVDAFKESIHSEGAPGIFNAVMSCNNFTKAQLMFYLDHLMEHKKTALGSWECLQMTRTCGWLPI